MEDNTPRQIRKIRTEHCLDALLGMGAGPIDLFQHLAYDHECSVTPEEVSQAITRNLGPRNQ